MKSRFEMQFDPAFRLRLEKAAAEQRMPLAALLRLASENYLDGTEPKLAEMRLKEAASLIQLQIDVEAISKNLHERQDEIDRANEDIQLLIAMVNGLATFVFGALLDNPETDLTAAIARERHARWLDNIRDDMVATRRRPATNVHLLYPEPSIQSEISTAPVTTNDRQSVNKMTLKGTIDRPVALRRIEQTGEPVANYRLITDGVDIHQIAAYGRDATFAATHFAAGDLVYMEGEFRTRTFQTAEDKVRNRHHTVRELCATKQQLLEKAPAPVLDHEQAESNARSLQ